MNAMRKRRRNSQVFASIPRLAVPRRCTNVKAGRKDRPRVLATIRGSNVLEVARAKLGVRTVRTSKNIKVLFYLVHTEQANASCQARLLKWRGSRCGGHLTVRITKPPGEELNNGHQTTASSS
jgi:hypothetical protein